MRNLGIGTWIHRRRVKSADSIAILDRDRSLRYDRLAERIDRLTNALYLRGVAAGHRVAYIGPNAAEFLETLFACGQLGAVFVPLNTRLAPDEIAYALADSGATLLFHTPEFTDRLARVSLPRVVAGAKPDAAAVGYEDMLIAAPAVHPDLPVALDDPAMILYTSGTTGRPKGAVLSHGNLTWNAINVLVDYDVTSAEVALMVSPLFHVASLGMGALPTLLKGGTLVLQPAFEPAAVLAAIAEHRVTTLSGVPTTFQVLAEHPHWSRTDLSSVTTLTCGGSPVPARVAEAYERRGLAFSSGYGLTETSPGATSLSPRHSRERSATSGLPHFFTDVRVVDPGGRDVPPGEIGEILISGPNVIAGYWNRPEATAQAMTDGWLHSGDLGFLDADGFLTITDRAKDMFVSGGENVYPAEVERVVMELPEIGAIAIIGVPDNRWGEVGRAVVVPAEGAAVTHDLVAQHLDGRVARYKIPKSTVVVPDLPRTASGKIRKSELRDRYGRAAPSALTRGRTEPAPADHEPDDDERWQHHDQTS
jgi:fatty-acyl-CoA synthase